MKKTPEEIQKLAEFSFSKSGLDAYMLRQGYIKGFTACQEMQDSEAGKTAIVHTSETLNKFFESEICPNCAKPNEVIEFIKWEKDFKSPVNTCDHIEWYRRIKLKPKDLYTEFKNRLTKP